MYPQQPKSTWKIILIIVLALLVVGESALIYKFYRDLKKEQTNFQNLQKQYEKVNKDLGACQKEKLKCEGTASQSESADQNTTSSCATTLTEADRTEMDGWKEQTNSTQKYTFSHPGSWKIETNETERVTLRDNTDGVDLYFQFLSGDMSATDIDPSFTQTDEKDIKIACVDTKETFLSSGDKRLISIIFEKADTPHVIFLSYKDVGASMSGDTQDAFSRVLKSITFE